MTKFAFVRVLVLVSLASPALGTAAAVAAPAFLAPACAAPMSAAAPALPPVAALELPQLTPAPVDRATYLCGSCSESDCSDQAEGDLCNGGTGTCYASLTTPCGIAHPRHYFCRCQ